MEQRVDTEKLRAIPIVTFFKRPARTRVQHVVCPFHNEKSASLALYPDNSFYCFGCQAHGKGAIDFVMQLGKVDFKTACEELASYG